MKDNFDIHPAAQGDIWDIIKYYAKASQGRNRRSLALEFWSSFNSHMDRIIDNPKLHPIYRKALRRVHLTPQFKNYYIAYTLRKGRVLVLAVGHAKRRPDYWHSRANEEPKIF